MNLDFVNNLFNNLKENKLAKDFMNELSDYLENNEWNNLLSDDLTINDTKIISKYKDIMLKEYGSDFEYDKCLQWVHDQMALQFETEGVPVKKGLIKLLEYLKHNGYKTMVATSSDRNRVDVILKNAGIDIYFDGAICGDEVKHGKPDPEVFLKACDKIDIKPEEGLVIEDSEAGIKAAHDGKIKVICIPDMKYPGKEYENMTYKILQNLEQVIPFVQ